MNDRHMAYINRYITFSEPLKMPCLLGKWTNTVDEIVEQAREIGCDARKVNLPVPAMEILGSKTKFLIRDHALAKAGEKPVKDIRIFDQFCIFALESKESAHQFIDALQQKIRECGHDIESTTVNESLNDRQRHFVCRSTIKSYGKVSLVVVSAIQHRFEAENHDAVDLLVNWKLNIYD